MIKFPVSISFVISTKERIKIREKKKSRHLV